MRAGAHERVTVRGLPVVALAIPFTNNSRRVPLRCYATAGYAAILSRLPVNNTGRNIKTGKPPSGADHNRERRQCDDANC